MPYRRNPADRARYRQAEMEKRAIREQTRRVVPLRQRRDDDWIVDEVAIDYALRGWPDHAERLGRKELLEAVAEGTRRGMGAPALADLLLLHEREVERLRDETRERAA